VAQLQLPLDGGFTISSSHTLYGRFTLRVLGGTTSRSDICARMMGNKPEFPASLYNSSDYMREQCSAMIEREFESWSTTIMVSLYFTALTFGVLQLLCHCIIVRPIVNAIKRPEQSVVVFQKQQPD
jgi:hypothetical protein